MDDLTAQLIGRVRETLAQASGRFPMSADPVTGEWRWSQDGGWFGGFWAGLLRLAAVAVGDADQVEAADAATATLRPRAASRTILRGMLFWYSAGISAGLGQASDSSDESVVAAALELSSGFDRVAGLIPPGTEDANQYGWPATGAVIDGLPGTTSLLVRAADRTGDTRLREQAASNIRVLHALCVRPDGSVAQSATYDEAGALVEQTAIEGSSRHSTWARAQTWAMLGFTQAAHLMPELTCAAVQIADWYLDHIPDDLVCFWDFDDPNIPNAPRDTSASATAAAALVKLAPLAGGRYRDAAAATVAALSERHISRHGALINGCYEWVNDVAIGNELIWGDYFLLEAALALNGTIDAASI